MGYELVRIIKVACLGIRPDQRIDRLVSFDDKIYRLKIWPLINCVGIGLTLTRQVQPSKKKGKK